MSLAIVTENLVFGETLSTACQARNIEVVDKFESIKAINRMAPGGLLLLHMRSDDPSIPSQLAELNDRFGALRFVFLISDRVSPEMRTEIDRIATIVVTEKEPADALISALTLAELGYHLSALTEAPETKDDDSPDEPSETHCTLSKREVTILGRLCEGMSNKCIARELGIRETTVKVHLRSTYRKIGVSNRTQAALWASREFAQGLVR